MVIVYRYAIALLVATAIITQFVVSSAVFGFNPINFFSFFTIESNILGIVAFVLSAIALQNRRQYAWVTYLRGAATLYMVITGIIYTLLLTGADVQTPIPWVNATIHYIFPVVILLDWLFDPPKRLPVFREALVWLLFPLAYCIYSLMRGPFAGWYPYPFLDVNQFGLGQVLLNALMIALGILVMAWLVAKLPSFMRKRG